MLKLYAGVLSERHQITKQKPVCGMDFVLVALRLFQVARSHRMAGKRQRHVDATPIVATPAPLLRSGPVRLGRLTVIEEKTRIPFQGPQIVLVSENERSPD